MPDDCCESCGEPLGDYDLREHCPDCDALLCSRCHQDVLDQPKLPVIEAIADIEVVNPKVWDETRRAATWN